VVVAIRQMTRIEKVITAVFNFTGSLFTTLDWGRAGENTSYGW
jgi:hypothetical protein